MVNGLFKNLESTLTALENYEHLKEVKKLLEIHQFKLSEFKSKLNNGRKNFLIVFEGINGTVKSNLTKIINRNIKGVIMSTPPKCIESLETFFDSQELELRSAFYSLGNYIASYEISATLERKDVILDRFWHSTAAYAIANSDTPAQNEDYEWPSNLIKPDIVFYLTIAEPARAQRMKHKILNAEEIKLKNDAEYREKIDTAHQNMKKPGINLIDCNTTHRRVKENVFDILRKFNLVNVVM